MYFRRKVPLFPAQKSRSEKSLERLLQAVAVQTRIAEAEEGCLRD